MLEGLPKELLKEIIDFELVIVCGVLGSLQMYPVILDEIRKAQSNDEFLTEIRERMKNKPHTEFASNQERTLEFKGRNCVPNVPILKEQLLEEAHQTPYSVHPGTTKMYQDLKHNYWWLGMKRDVLACMERCLICQQVKVAH